MEYSSNSGGSSCSRIRNEFLDDQRYTKINDLIRWKSGKRVDPRILTLLESFGEIHADRHEFFNKIFHGDHEELFKKIGDTLKKRKKMKKARSMARSMSMSMRAIGKRGVDEREDEVRDEWFKVKPPNVIVAEPDGSSQGGQTSSKVVK